MATPKESSAELMSAYIDAELDAAEAEAFESFLAETPEAQKELEDLRKMVELVSALQRVQAPPDFYEKLSRKLRRRAAFERDSGLLGLLTLPFQVICIVVILTVAALYMMAELDQQPQSIERDPASVPADDDAPKPVVP
jgi:anti-sigma factor RsiW